MLSDEQSEKVLKNFKTDDYVSRRDKLCGKLPARLRETGRAVTGRDAGGRAIQDWVKRSESQVRAAQHLDSLPVEQRKRVFTALFPQMADHVEAAWQMMKGMPYQSDWHRKPFRAPMTPEATLANRGQWLERLVVTTQEYDQPITWFAEWAGYIEESYYASALGVLLAAAMNDGGTEEGGKVFDILVAGATGEHEVARMGRHVIRALLLSSREDGWEFMEKMLLAAQRQEGLRQSILEAVDESHPGAFRRMIKVILDQNLVRFAATIRAADVWFGLMWDSAGAGPVRQVLTKVSEFLDDRTALDTALRGEDVEAAYLALWSIAFENAPAAIPPATRLLKHKRVEMRFAAAVLLERLGLTSGFEPLVPALADTDLRVAAIATAALADGHYAQQVPGSDVFERLEQLLDRFPKQKTKQKPLLWPWYELTIHRQTIGNALLANLSDRPIDRILPYISAMDANTRSQAINLIGERKRWDAPARATLFAFVGDASQSVRSAALEHIGRCKVTEQEAKGMEQLLTRKSGDLRRGVMTVLLGQSDAKALASIGRLLSVDHTMQRQAGLEMLRQLVEHNRVAEACRQRAHEFVAGRKKIPDEEQKLLDTVLDTAREVATLDDAIGLMNPAERCEIPPVVNRNVTFVTKAAEQILYSLDDLIHAYRESPVETTNWDGTKNETLLGNLQWGFPASDGSIDIAEDVHRLPLRSVWENWLSERPALTRDKDRLELFRAAGLLAASRCDDTGLNRKGKKRICPLNLEKLRYTEIIAGLLPWLTRMSLVDGAAGKLLDLLETSYALVPDRELRRIKDPHDWQDYTWRDYNSVYVAWTAIIEEHRRFFVNQWTPECLVRLWKLYRWRDEPVVVNLRGRERITLSRNRADVGLLANAYEAGGATDADIYDQLLGPRESGGDYYGAGFVDLRQLTSKKPPDVVKDHAWLAQFANRCRERILDVELERGETPTAASAAALSLSSAWGITDLVRIVRAIGKESLLRGWACDSESKKTVLSHLLRVAMPEKGDTSASLAAAVAQAGIPEGRLLEIAVYAPQWASLVEGVLKWYGMEDAIWWIHAHTKDDRWAVDSNIREAWAAEISQRTRLSPVDLVDGAVDVEWFNRAYSQLQKSKWEELHDAAKYASGGGGHKRAQLFADAMLGRVKKTELIKRIDNKRHQDAVRALGLLPLARGKSREQDLLDRYKQMQEFIRTSRQFGSQRQTSEKRAATIAQANLASTAGYNDPIRLQWAMEAKAVADLADGPITVTVNDTTLALAIDEFGGVDLSVTKGGKPLKSIPANLKSKKEVKALQERRKEIKRQVSRIRPTLEQMMCHGETVTGEELWELMEHPLISPMLGRLVLMSDENIGYPDEGGKVLRDDAGGRKPVKTTEMLRIAHAYDLYARRDWQRWQRDCFDRELVQPFKQVFRELYPLTKAELKEQTQSRRYAGQQVNPRQSLSLLSQRQWVTVPDEGVRKTFHKEELSVFIEFQEPFYTPADIDGLTLEAVQFKERGKWEVVPLAKVPPCIFSEAMRDLDLVVSVAHRGRVDPESSASTIEMRSNLLRETLALVDIENVRIEKNHAFVDGEIGKYSVHLGSAVTHKLPGGAMFLVPVHSQHRGRMFLPFADDDPKTAEVISKVLLLARDTEIKDPNILDQILLRT